MKGTIIEYVLGREFGYLKDEKKDEYCFYSDDIQFENSSLRKGDKVHPPSPETTGMPVEEDVLLRESVFTFRFVLAFI